MEHGSNHVDDQLLPAVRRSRCRQEFDAIVGSRRRPKQSRQCRKIRGGCLSPAPGQRDVSVRLSFLDYRQFPALSRQRLAPYRG